MKAEKYPEVVHDFLRRIHESLFLRLKEIRGLVTPDMWAMYELTLHDKELKEQILLLEQQRLLRVIWKRVTADKFGAWEKRENNPLPFEYLFSRREHDLKNKSGPVL